MAQVIFRDTAIVWHTFKYELNDDNTINWNTNTEFDTVSKIFSGIILENEYLKVTVVPEFGARIISMIYKPTGKEELYLNPCGAPYGVGEDWFYYKWLMVYGGIFPTLPEPEHGKAWLLPWKYSFLKETPDTVSLQMSWQDTVQLQDINLGKWQYGETNIKCNYTLYLFHRTAICQGLYPVIAQYPAMTSAGLQYQEFLSENYISMVKAMPCRVQAQARLEKFLRKPLAICNKTSPHQPRKEPRRDLDKVLLFLLVCIS